MVIKKFKNLAGVTLIELLVAVAITVIVGASVIGALYSGRSAWQSGDNIVRRHQNARAAIDLISRDLQQAAVFPDGAEYLADFLSDGNSLMFTAFTAEASEGFEIRIIAYRLEGGTIERAEIYYDPANLPDNPGDISDADYSPLAWDLEDLEFRFSYFDGTDWNYGEAVWDYWNDPEPLKTKRLPDRVNIIIYPVDYDEYIETTVKMPLAALRPYAQP